MIQHAGDAYALSWIQDNHLFDQVFDLCTNGVNWELEFALENQFVQVCDVVGFERDRALDHRIEKDSQTPYICSEALVALVDDDLRR